MNRFRVAFLLLLLGLAVGVVAPLRAINISTNQTYTQDFNTLNSTGTTNVWADNSSNPGSIIGWFAQAGVTFGSNYIANNGTLTSGDIYSYGASASGERALGSFNTSGTGNLAYGVTFTNNGSANMQFELISYTGEQWRNGVANQTLTFSYQKSFVAITDLTPTTDVGWTQVPGLTFTAPVSGIGAQLDGNLADNRTAVEFDLKANLQLIFLQPNETIMFRWLDIDFLSGTEVAMAIDDLSITVTVVPEPSSALLAFGGVGLLVARRRRS